MAQLDEQEWNVWKPTQYLIPVTKRAGLLVIAAGLLTTVGTIGLLKVLGKIDFNPMGWYINMIPLGALAVGMLAGSGYWISSRLTGAKIGIGLLVLVVLLQIGAYFSAQYVEYAELVADGSIPAEASFFDYFDVITRAFTVTSTRATDNKPAEPWGPWGYLLRLCEIVGFAAGGALAPALLRGEPYCDECQVYKRQPTLGYYAAGVKQQKISSRKQEATKQYNQQHAAAYESGLARGEELATLAKAADAEGLGQHLRAHTIRRKDAFKLTSHLFLKLEHCPQCHAGHAVLRMKTGNPQAKAVELWRLPLEPSFVERALAVGKKA